MTIAGFLTLAWIIRKGGPDSIKRREASRGRPGFFSLGQAIDNLLAGKKDKRATSEG